MAKTKPMTVREAARTRHPIDVADTQALEGALSQAERELEAAKAKNAQLREALAALVSFETWNDVTPDPEFESHWSAAVEKARDAIDESTEETGRFEIEDVLAVLSRDIARMVSSERREYATGLRDYLRRGFHHGEAAKLDAEKQKAALHQELAEPKT